MKNSHLAMAFALFFVWACQSRRMNKEAMNYKGSWQISSVDYNRNYRVRPFDENVDIRCFVGSTWTLVPNNFRGSYTLNGSGNCPAETQNIIFEVTENNEFRFKKIAPGEKARKINQGYVLGLQKQDDDHFTLVQHVPYEGNTLTVQYNFMRAENK